MIERRRKESCCAHSRARVRRRRRRGRLWVGHLAAPAPAVCVAATFGRGGKISAAGTVEAAKDPQCATQRDVVNLSTYQPTGSNPKRLDRVASSL